MAQQEKYSIQYLLANVSPSDASPGAIIASPSKADPNYYYHWIRDAALTSDVLVTLYQNGDKSRDYDQLLQNYVDFSRHLQTVPNPSGGLGEPKFNVDGTAFTGPWGRPQNDGPALRAAAMVRLARIWISQGRGDLVKQKLYDAPLPTTTLIKADLEYVAHHWRESSFDLWEEERGDHFYTRMAQRRAMVEGAALARQLNDGGAASFYDEQARALENEIRKHWNAQRGLLEPTLNWTGGVDYKTSGIDSAVILGVLHGHVDDFYSYTGDQVLATVHQQEVAFRNTFPINQRGLPAVAIGRYPEDRYSGFDTSSQGNPWLLTTMAFGELYHRAAHEFDASGVIVITPVDHDFFAALLGNDMPATTPFTITKGQPLFARILSALHAGGDAYMNRGHYHGQPDGHWAEQMNRNSGYMQSAADLTWNYASYLTAFWSR